MSGQQLFKVEKCTPSSKGGFIVKLQSKSVNTVQTVFGTIESNTQKTYYAKVQNEAKVGTEGPIDLSLFDVVTRDWEIDDEESEMFGETVQLDWLYPKRS